MSYNDTPEQPKSPFTPDPNKSIFDRSPIEPHPLVEPEDTATSTSPTPETDQETLSRAAAINAPKWKKNLLI